MTNSPDRNKQGDETQATPKRAGADRTAILAAGLARGRTIKQAAREAGYSERQAHRKLTDPDFVASVNQLRGRMLERSYGRLTATTAEAVRTLHALLQDEHAGVRLAAAKSILDYTGKFKESVEMTQRLERVEAILRAREQDDWQHSKSHS
jgi:molybdenum-dependent DNA-binding transcriptional regulator ModE